MEKKKKYFKIYESIKTSEFWPQAGEVYAKSEAWIDMVFMANLYERDWRGVKIPRGSFATSVRSLAKKWSWSKSAVHRFLVENSGTQMERKMGQEVGHELGHHNYKDFTVVEIINYDLYNPIGTPDGTDDGTLSGTQMGHTKYIYNNKRGKTEEEKIKKIISINPGVGVVLDKWEKLHPSFLPRLSDAQVARDLVQGKGLDPVLKAMEAAHKVEAKQYAPVILTLPDLQRKWENLKVYLLREKNEDRDENQSGRDDEVGVIRNALGKIVN